MGTVADLTVPELRELIAQVVEEKLAELVSDPDEGRTLRADLVSDLRERMARVQQGERGVAAEDALARLKL